MPRRSGAGLSRERVLEAGLDLVDREGMEALTMRRLGRELGVEAMSLYGHVRSKQDLLDGVVDRVYDELPQIAGGDRPWPEPLREAARSLRQVLLAHPNIVALVAVRPMLSVAKLGVAEALLAHVRRRGLDPMPASQAVTVMMAFTIGHVLNEAGDPAAATATPLPGVDPVRFPNIAERCRLGPPNRDASFELGLDFVVAGIEQLASSALVAG